MAYRRPTSACISPPSPLLFGSQHFPMQVERNDLESSATAEAKVATALTVPSTKGHRPWKKSKRRPASAQRRTASFKPTLEQKNRKRQQREALMVVVRAAKEADVAAKEAERHRREEKKKRQRENDIRGTQRPVITDPKKIARMSKKQYLSYVHSNKPTTTK